MSDEQRDAVQVIELICPGCGKPVSTENPKCRFCGARQTINSVTGNIIWMRNGKVVSAFADEKAAYLSMAETWHVPRDLWPARFKEEK
jgi:hypothetical protein